MTQRAAYNEHLLHSLVDVLCNVRSSVTDRNLYKYTLGVEPAYKQRRVGGSILLMRLVHSHVGNSLKICAHSSTMTEVQVPGCEKKQR